MKWCEQTGRDIDDVTKADLLNHLDDMVLTDGDTTAAHSSVGSRVNSITRFYTWANGRERLTANPCEKFEFERDYPQIDPNVSQKYLVLRRQNPEEDSNAILAISEESVENIAAHASSDRDELVIRLFWQTGVRASEMAGIKLDHIDRDDHSILIYTAKAKEKDSNYTRRVYYQPNLDYLLDEWMVKREQYSTSNSEYLFNNMHSEDTNAGTLSRIVKETAIEAGENEVMYTDTAGRRRWLVTAHTLRHSFGSYCANEAELPLHIIADVMGHKSLDTTRDYISTSGEKRKEFLHERGPGSEKF
jgi:integrase/recombinase XerD